MDTALPLKFPFILDKNLANTYCTENHVCMSCDTVVLGLYQIFTHVFSGNSVFTCLNNKFCKSIYYLLTVNSNFSAKKSEFRKRTFTARL